MIEIITGTDMHLLVEGARKAVDFRGDITVALRSGETVVGYAFDLERSPAIEQSRLQLLVDGSDVPTRVSLKDIATLAFTGKDTAAGKSWSSWMARYAAKKLAGEAASIPAEELD